MNSEYSWLLNEPDLNKLLSKFWFEGRTQRVKKYTVSSLAHLWYGINRMLKRKGHEYDIVHSSSFTGCSGGSRISRGGGGGADLVGGGANSRGGYILKNLYVKTKESGPLGGAHWQHPLDPPMGCQSAFTDACKELKQEGLGVVNSYKEIEPKSSYNLTFPTIQHMLKFSKTLKNYTKLLSN